jgi:FKBP-type peptidyl-prolyl cis-trans isomerase 2
MSNKDELTELFKELVGMEETYHGKFFMGSTNKEKILKKIPIDNISNNLFEVGEILNFGNNEKSKYGIINEIKSNHMIIDIESPFTNNDLTLIVKVEKIKK